MPILKDYLTSSDPEEKQTTNPVVYFFSWLAILVALQIISQYNYLLFHSLTELFSLVIACAIFTVAWNSRRFSSNNYLFIIGISYLFVASIDFIHILSFRGMGVFANASNNTATQLWIAARYLQSLSLLLAALWLFKKNKEALKAGLIFFVYLAITSFVFLSIFYWHNFPTAYVDDIGLTPFKKISEYIISIILLVSLFPLAKKAKEFDSSVFWLIILSVIIMILSELSFTFYVDPYGLFNKIGHFLKIVSFYFIYRAVVVANFKDPFAFLFKNLKTKEMALAATLKEARQKSESLKISEQMYQDALIYTQGIINTVQQPMLVLNEEFKIDSANKSFYDFFQISREETEKKSIYDIFEQKWKNPELSERVQKAFFQNERFFNVELTLNYPKIGEKTHLFSGKIIKRPGNRPALLLLSADDITERKQMEKKIEHLASFPQLNPNPVIELDTQGNVIFSNLATAKVLRNLKAEQDARFFLPDSLPEVIKNLKQKEAPLLYREVKIKNRVFAENLHLLKELNVIRVYATDITELKIAEKTLEENQKNLQSLFESDIIGIVYANEETLIEANDAFLKMLGYNRQDLLNKKIDWQKITLPEYRALDEKARQEMADQGSCTPFEKEYLRQDGSRLPILIGTTVIDQSPIKWVSFVLDITKRKQTENSLQETKDYLEKLISHANAPIVVWNPNYEIIKFNHAFEQLTGYMASEIIGEKLDIIFPKTGNKIYENPPDGHWDSLEIPILCKDGSARMLLCSSANIYNNYYEDNRALIAIIAQAQDITELKRVDTAKTEFISLAAHQLRTPLATLRLTAETLKRDMIGEKNKETRQYLDDISGDIASMTELIETFLDVSRIEMGTFPINPKPADLIKAVDGILTEMMPQIGNKHLKLKKQYCSNLLMLDLDQKALHVILENLLSNAIKYTGENGTITVEIEKDRTDIIIKVADNGWGIPKDQQTRIFDKMYRATNVQNTSSEGVGLGLYMVKSILEQAGGKIWCQSKENKGTTFYVSLPLTGMKKKKTD